MHLLTLPKKSSQPVRIDSVLGPTLAELGLDRDLDDYRVWIAWDEVVGETIARNAQPQRLSGGRLVIVVRSSGWLQELSLLQGELVQQLNAWMESPVVRELYLVVGRVERVRPPARPLPTENTSAKDEPANKPGGGSGRGEGQPTIDQALAALWRAARSRRGRKRRAE